MKKLKIRTKIEVGIVIAILIVIIASFSVSSLTRIITSDSDNVVTFIRNSRGNIWEATGDNIQLAIDDLGDDGGKVWVGSSITLASPIRMSSYVTLDFQSNKVTLLGDTEFINFSTDSGGCKYNTVKNAHVFPAEGYTGSIISMYIPDISYSGHWNWQVRFNTIENINIIEQSTNRCEHNWTGIHLKLDGDSDISMNYFRDFQIWGCRNGILLESNHAGAYANGNEFSDFFVSGFVNGTAFIDISGDSFNANSWNNFKTQSIGSSSNPGCGYTEPTYGFYNISGNSNVLDQCLIWDFEVLADNPKYTYWVGQDAIDTQINSQESYKVSYDNILDEGTNTCIQIGGFIRPQLYQETWPPSGFEDGQSMIWIDTDDNNSTYLCFFWNGERNLVKLE